MGKIEPFDFDHITQVEGIRDEHGSILFFCTAQTLLDNR